MGNNHVKNLDDAMTKGSSDEEKEFGDFLCGVDVNKRTTLSNKIVYKKF